MNTFREQVLRIVSETLSLSATDLHALYDAVVCEAEAWDGEYVEPEYVAATMIKRYRAVGLIPSRN
jgi:hypothetical protein